MSVPDVFVDVSALPLIADEQYVRDVQAGLDPAPPRFVDLTAYPLEPDPELERELREASA